MEGKSLKKNYFLILEWRKKGQEQNIKKKRRRNVTNFPSLFSSNKGEKSRIFHNNLFIFLLILSSISKQERNIVKFSYIFLSL